MEMHIPFDLLFGYEMPGRFDEYQALVLRHG